MMMPSRVRKLRRVWARMARSASRPSSVKLMTSSARRDRSALLRGLPLDRVRGLERAQRLEGAGHEGLAAREALRHLDGELPEQAGLDRLEAGLAVVHQVDALFFTPRTRSWGFAGLALGLAQDEGLERHHQGLGAEAGEDVRLDGEPRLDPLGRVLDLDLDLDLDGLVLARGRARLHKGAAPDPCNHPVHALIPPPIAPH